MLTQIFVVQRERGGAEADLLLAEPLEREFLSVTFDGATRSPEETRVTSPARNRRASLSEDAVQQRWRPSESRYETS